VDFGKSGRIVVTDLFNYAMPLIRYDTGDIGVMTKTGEPGKKRLFFPRIEGRKLDFIHSTAGKRLSPHFIDHALRKYDSIDQFQLVQTGKTRYILKLNTVNTSESFYRDVKSTLKKYVGDDALISIEFVHEIPLLSSGKRQFVVNELNLN
jgi:phenylacetate-CoA ligase